MDEKMSLEERKTELLAVLNRRTGRAFRVLPHGVGRLLSAFSLDEIDLALLALSRDGWHRERLRELGAEYLLRPVTVDKWLQRAGPAYRANQLNAEPLVTI